MRVADFFRMGLTNLSRRKARTILTALSMAIGVMCIVVLISIGLGYEATYREQVEAMGSLTKIDVTPPRDAYGKVALLNDKAVDAFRGLNGVETATPVVQATAYLKSGKYIGMVKLYGIDLTTAERFLIAPTQGEAPEAGTHMRPQVMLTDDLSASFSDPNNDYKAALDRDGNPVVDVLYSRIKLTFDSANLSGQYSEGADGRAVAAGKLYPLEVSGICSAQNYTYATSGFLDRVRLEEWIEANALYTGGPRREEKEGKKQEAGKTYDLVWVKVTRAEDVQAVADTIRNAGFQTYSLNDMLESVKEQSKQIQGMLAAIGVVTMLVSAFCTANTMMMSINERRKEIGVLKVLGSSLKDIALTFLIEAFLVGMVGGFFGLAFSFGLRQLIPVLFAAMKVRSIVPLWLAAGGVIFSGVVAILSALIPALGAMRVSPLDAIRAQ